MNTCPVCRRSGGLSYGAVYSGPIGAIIDPTFNERKYSTLPYASTLNGSCTNVCPVKINIHEQRTNGAAHWCSTMKCPSSSVRSCTWRASLWVSPRCTRAAIKMTEVSLGSMPRFVLYNWLNPWGKHRENPHPVKQTFNDWYRKNREKAKPAAASETKK